MTKYWVFVEGQRKYMNQFEDYLSSREYKNQLPNLPGTISKPIVNEVRLYDISVFESAVPHLLSDLKPFSGIDIHLPKWLLPFTWVFRKVFGLYNSKGESVISKDEENKHNIKTHIIGYKDDSWVNGVEMI